LKLRDFLTKEATKWFCPPTSVHSTTPQQFTTASWFFHVLRRLALSPEDRSRVRARERSVIIVFKKSILVYIFLLLRMQMVQRCAERVVEAAVAFCGALQ
jgi:hypothetical protein